MSTGSDAPLTQAGSILGKDRNNVVSTQLKAMNLYDFERMLSDQRKSSS